MQRRVIEGHFYFLGVEVLGTVWFWCYDPADRF